MKENIIENNKLEIKNEILKYIKMSYVSIIMTIYMVLSITNDGYFDNVSIFLMGITFVFPFLCFIQGYFNGDNLLLVLGSMLFNITALTIFIFELLNNTAYSYVPIYILSELIGMVLRKTKIYCR